MPGERIARLSQELHARKGAVLATIVKRIGSAPWSGGSRMLVFLDHTIFGTIGGGSLEALVRETAAEVMTSKINQMKEYNNK